MKQGKRTQQQIFEDFMRLDGMADAMAEALMVHDDCCGLHAAAALTLELAGVSGVDFIINWVSAKYDG